MSILKLEAQIFLSFKTVSSVNPLNLLPLQQPQPAPRGSSVDVTVDGGVSLVSALIEHNEALSEKLLKCEEEEGVKKSKITELTRQLDELRLRLNDIDQESDAIDERNRERNEGNKTAEEVQSFLTTYERLKSDERKFKEMCNSELERLQSLASQAGERNFFEFPVIHFLPI
jgi:hypothetical protein